MSWTVKRIEKKCIEGSRERQIEPSGFSVSAYRGDGSRVTATSSRLGGSSVVPLVSSSLQSASFSKRADCVVKCPVSPDGKGWMGLIMLRPRPQVQQGSYGPIGSRSPRG